jgi:hypothetical protein
MVWEKKHVLGRGMNIRERYEYKERKRILLKILYKSQSGLAHLHVKICE